MRDLDLMYFGNVAFSVESVIQSSLSKETTLLRHSFESKELFQKRLDFRGLYSFSNFCLSKETRLLRDSVKRDWTLGDSTLFQFFFFQKRRDS